RHGTVSAARPRGGAGAPEPHGGDGHGDRRRGQAMTAAVGIALALVAVLAATPVAGQTPTKSARVGMLRNDAPGPSGGTSPENWAAFKQGLADEGFVEGRSLVIDIVTPRTDNERLEEVVRGLVRLNVDVIQASGPQAVRAASMVTTTIPIVAYDFETDPVAA